MTVAAKPSWFARLKDRFVPSKREVIERLIKAVRWSHRRIPFGVRTLAGIPLIVGGLLSFLPVLGLWMLPVGLALVALDIPVLRRRLLAWMDREEAKLRATQPPPAATAEATPAQVPRAGPTRSGG
ncbi:MAG: hypothetical protein ACFCVH_13950 [Alphaproteobacteria bacterium]